MQNMFNIEFLVGMYRMFGRASFIRMLSIPGGPLLAQQKKNKDDPAEIIAKRDALAVALADLVEEYANLDDD